MHYGKRSSRQRPHDAANSSRTQSGASAGPSPRQPIRPQRQNRPEMAQPLRDHRRADRADGLEYNMEDTQADDWSTPIASFISPGRRGRQATMVARIYKARFTNRENIFDHASFVRCAS